MNLSPESRALLLSALETIRFEADLAHRLATEELPGWPSGVEQALRPISHALHSIRSELLYNAPTNQLPPTKQPSTSLENLA